MDPRLAGGVVSVPGASGGQAPAALVHRRQRLRRVRICPTAALDGQRLPPRADWPVWHAFANGRCARRPPAPRPPRAMRLRQSMSSTRRRTAGCEGMRLVVTLADGESNVVWSDQFTLQVADLLDFSATHRARHRDSLEGQPLGRSSAAHVGPSRSERSSARLLAARTGLRARASAPRTGGARRSCSRRSPRRRRISLRSSAASFSSATRGTSFFPECSASNKEHSDALRLAQRAVQLDPQDSRAQLCVAWAHQLTGRTTEAILHAELAVDLNPNDSWTLIAAAQIQAYCGSYEKAVALCNQSMAQTIAPDRSAPRVCDRRSCSWRSAIRKAWMHRAMGWSRRPHSRSGEPLRLPNSATCKRRAICWQQPSSDIRAKWNGPAPEDDRTIYHWLLHMFPIAVESDWQRLRRSLAMAGGAVDQEQYRAW